LWLFNWTRFNNFECLNKVVNFNIIILFSCYFQFSQQEINKAILKVKDENSTSEHQLYQLYEAKVINSSIFNTLTWESKLHEPKFNAFVDQDSKSLSFFFWSFQALSTSTRSSIIWSRSGSLVIWQDDPVCPHSEACLRIPGGYTSVYRLPSPESIHGLMAMLLLYRFSPPEAIHGLMAMLLLYRLPSLETIQDLSDLTSFLRHFWHSSLVSGSVLAHSDITDALLHLFTMIDSLRLSSNRLPETDLTAPLSSIEGTYSRFSFLILGYIA